MGNSSSRRQRPTLQQQQQQQQQPYNNPYPPPAVFQPQGQAPQYYGQDPYVNNGQYFGGWAPPFRPPYPQGGAPLPPQVPQQAAFLPNGAPIPPVQPEQQLTQTATIRNAVNLKKHTLKLVPVPGAAGKLAVQFMFDASSPCCVSTYVVATEAQANGCRLTMTKQSPAACIRYDKGLNLKFPPPGMDSSHSLLDLSLYDWSELSQASGDTFPLIVRLETITDKGLAEGHTLQELQPGGEQKLWVQSQTTFATIVKEEDGTYVGRVLKQKIWVEGVSYELQEIYGMGEGASGAPKHTDQERAEDLEERLCVICLVNNRDTTVLPCRHMCMCRDCAQELRKQTSKCPICRNQVESLLHIKVNKVDKSGKATPTSPSQSTPTSPGQGPA